MVKRKRTTKDRPPIMWAIAVFAVVGSAFAFSSGVNMQTQVAAGGAADLMCVGGADAECPCNKGKKNGRCDPGTQGGGKIGCPCHDITSGDVAASGKCAVVGKCLADKADGMMPMLPMLPMIPMMMPMPEMPGMPKICPPSKGASTTSAGASTTDKDKRNNIDCIPSESGFENSWFPSYTGTGSSLINTLTGTNNTPAPSDPKLSGTWGKLLNSLGFSSGTTGGENKAPQGTVGTVLPSGLNAVQITSQNGTTDGKNAASGNATYISPGLSRGGSTFSSFGTDPATSDPSSALSNIASTLRSLLATITGWIR